MHITRKMAKITLAAALMLAPVIGQAYAANEKTGKPFCTKYAENTAAIVSEAMKKNSACLDPDRGVHPSVEHHFTWCMQNSRSTVKGAAANIRRLVAECTGGTPGKQKPKKEASGGERFCQQYAETTAAVVSDALKVNPSCLDPSRGVHPDVNSHYTWCMKTPRSEVEGAGMHIRDLVAACAN